MVYYRLIDPAHWHSKEHRFVSLAFKNSEGLSGGRGISILDSECIAGSGLTPCAHIYEYYGDRPMPALIWPIESEELPAHEKQFDDSQGDPCHYNLLNISNKDARDFLKQKLNQADPTPVVYCPHPTAAPVSLGPDQLKIWIQAHDGNFQGQS